MKKRLLSLLLVACMLLSMVPVFSTVAVAADTDKAGAYDYSKLYVTDGLLGLYTAYTGDSTLDLANKVWKDISGKGNDATVNGTWTAGTYGGFGYDLAAKNNDYNLTFPSDVLPTDEYTLEIVASVRGLTANADGVSQTVNAYNDSAGISLGRLRGFFWFGPKGSNERYANAFVHMITEADTTTADGWSSCGSASGNWNNVTKIWQSDTSIVTGGIALTTANNKYTYSFYKDNVLCQPTASTTCAVTEGSAYQGSFILFRSVPATVYSVRLYDDTLTTLEKAQNHFADLAAFYQLDLTDFDKASAERKAGVYQSLYSFELSADAYEDGKKAVEDMLVDLLERPDVDYASLYVGGDSLVGLYTSFIGDSSLDMQTGEWKNSVANGPSAQITTVAAWHWTAFGAVGYDAASITTDRDGTQTTNRSLQLPLAFNGDNFTVEVLVNWRMCLDEAGTRLGYKESAPATGHPGTQIFRFGRMGSFCYKTETMALRWHYSDWNNAQLGGTKAADGIDLNPNRPYTLNDVVQPNSAYRTYYDTGKVYNHAAFYTTDFGGVYNVGLVAFTKTTDAAGTEKYGTYTQTKASTTIATITQAQKDLLDAATYEYTYTDENGDPATGTWDKLANSSAKYALHGFTLFNESPAYLYAVRVYNRALNDAEKNMNYFVDICAFYGVDLTGFAALSQAKKEKAVNSLLDELKGYSMQNDDLTAYTAERKAAQAILDAFVLNEYDLLYVGADGSETVNGGKLTMFLSAMAGNNTADLASGKWYDKVGAHHASFVNTSSVSWISRGENGVGYDLYGGSWNGSDWDTAGTNLQNGAQLTLNVNAMKDLNDSAYTFESIVAFPSVQWTDENGQLQTTGYTRSVYEWVVSDSDAIGNLYAIYQRSDSTGTLDVVRRTRWYLGNGVGNWNNTGVVGSNRYGCFSDSPARNNGGAIYNQNIERRWLNDVPFDTYVFKDAGGNELATAGKTQIDQRHVSDAAVLDTTGNTRYYLVEYDVVVDSNKGTVNPAYKLLAEDGTVLYEMLFSAVYTWLAPLLTTDEAKPLYFTVSAGTDVTKQVTYYINGAGYGRNFYTNERYAYTASKQTSAFATYSNMPVYASDSVANEFFMFKNAPCSVYSIRLYDAVLVASEKAQNHFADLCAYYLVDIAGFANATADAKTAAYAAVAELKLLAEGDAEYVATKAKVQAAVDNAKATEFEAGTVLPATVEGVADRVVAVWTNGSAKYLPGTVLAEAATLTPVLVAKGETVNGASVNVANGGLRFKATFSASDYYNLGKVMGNENAVLSMVIAPKVLVEKVANGVFTKEALTDKNDNCNYVEVAINGYYDLEGDTYTFAAGLSELSDVTKANDLSFAAVLCLTVKVGKETYEIYGDYNADCNRSGLEVLTPYIEDVIAGEIEVGPDLPADLTDDLVSLYTGFADHDPDLADSLETALGLK